MSVWSHWHSPPESPLDYLNENFSNATAWQFLAWLVHHPDPSPKYLAETIKALKAFPFSEDRFIWPYFLAQKKFPALNLHQSLLDYLVKYVSSYFWACVFGGLALGDGRKHLALNAFERAKDLARNTHVTLTHSNMDYLSVLTESKSPLKPFLYPMMPDDVDEVIRIYRSDLIKSGLNSKTVTLITGIPFPAHMFKPRYPFLEETDSKSSLVGRFVEIFTAPSAVQHRRFKIAPSWPPF